MNQKQLDVIIDTVNQYRDKEVLEESEYHLFRIFATYIDSENIKEVETKRESGKDSLLNYLQSEQNKINIAKQSVNHILRKEVNWKEKQRKVVVRGSLMML